MAQLFGHEKLTVYQKGMEFAANRSELLNGLRRRVAASDHLDRGTESILVNLAEIVSILIAMRKTTANRVCEAHAVYRTEKGRMFSHHVKMYRGNAHIAFKGRSP